MKNIKQYEKFTKRKLKSSHLSYSLVLNRPYCRFPGTGQVMHEADLCHLCYPLFQAHWDIYALCDPLFQAHWDICVVGSFISSSFGYIPSI